MVVSSGIAFCIAFGVTVLSIYKRDVQKSPYFSLLCLAVLFYLLGNFFEVINSSVAAALVGKYITYLGIPFIPPLWYLCVREFCGEKALRPPVLLVLMVLPLAILGLAYTWELNGLLFQGFSFYAKDGAATQLNPMEGPLYPLLWGLYLFNLMGLYTIISRYLRGTRRFRRQAVFFVASTLIPLFNTATFVVTIADIPTDITPYGLALALVVFYLTLSRYGLLNSSSIIKDSVLDHLHEGVLIFDKEGIFMYANELIKNLFPSLRDVPAGTSIEEMDYLPFEPTAVEQNTSTMQDFTKEQGGSVMTFRLSSSQVQFRGARAGFSVVVYNITALKEIMVDLAAKAHIDALTGIYNRGYLFEAGEREVERVRRKGHPLSVLMFDLDFFKRINDTYGHPYGDYVLKTVAFLCSSSLRRTDIFARYGGEEFCVLMPETDYESALNKAKILRSKIEAHLFEYEGVRTTVTASFGVTCLEKDETISGIQQLVTRADGKLYEAKHKGRNRVC